MCLPDRAICIRGPTLGCSLIVQPFPLNYYLLVSTRGLLLVRGGGSGGYSVVSIAPCPAHKGLARVWLFCCWCLHTHSLDRNTAVVQTRRNPEPPSPPPLPRSQPALLCSSSSSSSIIPSFVACHPSLPAVSRRINARAMYM